MGGRHRVEVAIEAPVPVGIDADRLAAVVRFTLGREGVTAPRTVGVIVVDDATIQALHARHMGIDEPTDVLTFALDADDGFVSREAAPLLGEVVVSADTAALHAAEYGQSVAREIAFLAVHGLLHLLGHDDATPAERAAMLARQEAILAAFERATGDIA